MKIVTLKFPSMQSALADGTTLQDRYCILHALGQGSNGITYAAEDAQTGKTVAIKVLSLAGLKDWKQLELFEREANVLKNLDHPGIPDYLDYFQVSHEGDQSFCLVQELAEGQSLSAWAEQGWHIEEAEAKRIARAVLDILNYLHSLHPPIVHRDLKPQNIILRDDGQIFLVDFGAVQTIYQDTMLSGSTIVGTYGYMAPEQFRGAACPASDLYALGGTLLFLLTHRSPADLPQTRMKVDFRDAIQLSDDFADWLDGLLEPVAEDRFASATEAIAALETPPKRHGGFVAAGDRNALNIQQRSQKKLIQKPSNTSIQLTMRRHHLDLVVPPSGLQGEAMALGGFALFWNGFIFVFTFFGLFADGGLVMLLFTIPFWLVGLGMLYGVFNGLFGRTELLVDRAGYQLKKQLLFWKRSYSGPVSDLYGVELQTRYSQNDRPVKCVALKAGVKTYKFGTLLSEPEKAWLVQELANFLAKS